jgi:hypothetical protein
VPVDFEIDKNTASVQDSTAFCISVHSNKKASVSFSIFSGPSTSSQEPIKTSLCTALTSQGDWQSVVRVCEKGLLIDADAASL